MQLEFAVLNWIQAVFRCAVLDAVMPVFTALANHGEIWIILALVLLVRKKTRATGLALGCGLALDGIVCNLLLKPLVGRVRPFAINTAVQLLIEAPLDASFPSGHTAVSFAAAGALYGAGSPHWRWAAVIAALMGFSRLYLYVHWPSDVLAGAVIGWLCGLAGAKAMKNFGKKQTKE